MMVQIQTLRLDTTPRIPARRVADVIAAGAQRHARIDVHPESGRARLVVTRDMIHPEIGVLVLRGWQYSRLHHCAYVRLEAR